MDLSLTHIKHTHTTLTYNTNIITSLTNITHKITSLTCNTPPITPLTCNTHTISPSHARNTHNPPPSHTTYKSSFHPLKVEILISADVRISQILEIVSKNKSAPH